MSRTLNVEEALALHSMALQAYGGRPGIRDRGMLESALAQPLASFGGRSLYAEPWEATAALGYSLVCNHPFVDGNKRVGFAAMAVVLLRGGWKLACTADEIEATMLALAAGQLSREDLALWLEHHAAVR